MHHRRRFARSIALAVGAILIGTLASCSSSDDQPSPPAETIDYSFAGYSAQIPADPQRVVVIDSRTSLEFALLADYPIVALDYDESSHLASKVPADAGHLGGNLSKEDVLSYNPDLILISVGWYESYKSQNLTFEDVAPVLVIQDGSSPDKETESLGGPLGFMGEQLALLGKTDAASAAQARYEDALATARDDVGSVAQTKTIAFVSLIEDKFFVFNTPNNLTVDVASSLGYTILSNDAITAAQSAAIGGYSAEFGWENADVLADADVVVAQNLDSWPGNPAWDRVPAVAAGNVAPLDYDDKVGFALTYTDFLNKLADTTRNLQ